MRIALAQINPTIGDIEGNTDLIRRRIEQAEEAGAELVVLPELAVIGYPPKDLLLKPAVIEDCRKAVEALAAQCSRIAAVIGYPGPTGGARGRPLHNLAALCAGGRIVHQHAKGLLPSYDVFDEQRYFEPGPAIDLAHHQGRAMGLSICEDLWNDERLFPRPIYHDNPIDQLAERGAQLLINCAASPFTVGKQAFRKKLMRHAARRHRLPLVYCNQVGGNDDLVFDGGSCAFDQEGNLLAQGTGFGEDLLIVEVPCPAGRGSSLAGRGPAASADPPTEDAAAPPARPPAAETGPPSTRANRVEAYPDDLACAYHALVLGLRDYCRKCGFKRIVLGLSGGIDSAVACVLATAALGREHVRTVSMPSRYSSVGTRSDARRLAENLELAFDEIAIEQPHQALEDLLAPYFAGLERDETEENLQARVRGIVLMALSNKFHSLVVSTGNKSEIAVGYSTLYGDMAGGLAVLSDVPKTLVYELARWINEDEASPLRKAGPVIPEAIITRAPSAELRPDQTDQDTLPPYDVLDRIIERYVEQEQDARLIVEQTGVATDVVLGVIRLIDRSEYKRQQMPPGLKITSRAFGFGRRMPIAQRYEAPWGPGQKAEAGADPASPRD